MNLLSVEVDAAQDLGRLKTDGNPKGFIPGEASAFLVVERRSTTQHRGAGCYALVDSVANTQEAHGYYEREVPCTGEGLTRAIRAALDACARPSDVSLVLCDLNGERHRANEWGLAMSRCFPDDDVPRGLWHPADSIGDTGAASSVLNLVFGTLAVARANASGSALAWGSSDDGERGAAILSAPPASAAFREAPSWA